MRGTVSNLVRLCRANYTPTNYRNTQRTGLVQGKVWCLFRVAERSGHGIRWRLGTDRFLATTNAMDRTQYRHLVVLLWSTAFPSLEVWWPRSFYAYPASFRGRSGTFHRCETKPPRSENRRCPGNCFLHRLAHSCRQREPGWELSQRSLLGLWLARGSGFFRVQ